MLRPFPSRRASIKHVHRKSFVFTRLIYGAHFEFPYRKRVRSTIFFFFRICYYSQLMTALCKMPGGHSRVSEALTTLRLNMGESVS